MQRKPEISLSMTMYNEEDCAEDVVNDLVNEFERKNVDYELILVNNGSVDSTPKIIEYLAKKNSRIKIVHFKKNQGFGGGVLAGMNHAKGEYIGFTCSDGQVTSEDTLKLFNMLKYGNYDLCKTIRFFREYTLLRRLASFFYNFLVFLLFPPSAPDVNGYPIVMKHGVFNKLNIKSKNWMIQLEIIKKARKLNMSLGILPIKFFKRKGGKSVVRLFTIFEFLYQIAKLRLKGV